MTDPRLPGPLTRAEGLAIIRANCSPDDISRFEATAEGQAALAGLVDVFVELSRKLDRTVTAQHLVARPSDVNPPAGGATKATATVSIVRADVGVGYTLPASSPSCIVVSDGGHRYQLLAEVVFAPGELGPKTVSAEALVAGFASTVIERSINAFASAANGASGDLASVQVSSYTGRMYLRCGAGDRIVKDLRGLYVEFTAGTNLGRFARIRTVLADDLAWIDGTGIVAETATATWVVREWSELGFTVSQAADSSQGTDDELDARAREVNLERQTGQTDAQLLAARLSLTDVVSPPAILSLANRVLGPYGPVLMYETGLSEGESDPAIGLMPMPGYVAGLSPCGVMPDAMDVTTDGTPMGLMCTAPATGFFVLRWDGAGLGDPGGCATGTSVGAPVDDTDPPHMAAAGVSPAGGSAFDDDAIRSAVTDAVNRIKAAGVRWRWYPRIWR